MDDLEGLHDPLALFFVRRLRRLVELERTEDLTDGNPLVHRAVHKAIFTTWLDCIEAGAGDDATRLLECLRRPLPSAA